MLKNIITLLVHILLSALLACIVSIPGYMIFLNALQKDQVEQALAYINVKAESQRALFEDAEQLNRSAESVFRRRYELLSDVNIDENFDRLFPLQVDGTRRSAPDLFDGVTMPDGDIVFGIGAFIALGETMSESEKRRYLAAFHAVHSVGEAYLQEFANLYFFTPDRRMVMFAPGREDRLEFYRINAPADFELRGDEDADLFSASTNPDRNMQCTQLSRLVSESQGMRSASACRLPVWDGDELLGAFGTSIYMTNYLIDALENPPAYGTNMLFDRNGNIISRGIDYYDELHGSDGDVNINSEGVIALIQDDGRMQGVIIDQASKHLISFARLENPSWYFVSVIHAEENFKTASFWSRILFLITLLAATAAATIRGVFAQMRPLDRVNLSAASPSEDANKDHWLIDRNDFQSER